MLMYKLLKSARYLRTPESSIKPVKIPSFLLLLLFFRVNCLKESGSYMDQKSQSQLVSNKRVPLYATQCITYA